MKALIFLIILALVPILSEHGGSGGGGTGGGDHGSFNAPLGTGS